MYALAAPHERGRSEAPELRPEGITPQTQVPFAFTAPLGLVNPMTRTHDRLLGPCFKTGRRHRRPTRNRDGGRASVTLAIRAPLATHRVWSQRRGAQGRTSNFTHALGRVPVVRCVKGWRNAASEPASQSAESLRIPNTQAANTIA